MIGKLKNWLVESIMLKINMGLPITREALAGWVGVALRKFMFEEAVELRNTSTGLAKKFCPKCKNSLIDGMCTECSYCLPKESICPVCGGKLSYADFTLADGNQAYYKVYCPQLNCDFTGKEWYNLVFEEITKD